MLFAKELAWMMEQVKRFALWWGPELAMQACRQGSGQTGLGGDGLKNGQDVDFERSRVALPLSC